MYQNPVSKKLAWFFHLFLLPLAGVTENSGNPQEQTILSSSLKLSECEPGWGSTDTLKFCPCSQL